MSGPVLGGLGFVAAILMVLLGLPVGVSMILTGALGFAILNGIPSAEYILGLAVYDSVSAYSLSVIPLFLLMGVFAARTRLSSDLFAFVAAMIGHKKGGLAVASIGACAGFGAICGSSMATVATIAPAALPEMERRGYSRQLAAGSVAAGGTLGILIPPSVILVVYALLTQQSLGALFVAAMIPACLGIALYVLAVLIKVRLDPTAGPPGPKASWAERCGAMLRVWPVLLLFALVMGGIYTGLFTPTEAAAVGAAGSILLGVATQSLSRKGFALAARETVETTGMLFLVMIGAAVFNYMVETSGLANGLIIWVEASGLSPMGTMILLVVAYVLLGCVMDALAIILLTVPLVYPLVTGLGFDPIWFGIVVVTVTEIGLITPPIGMNLFVIQGVSRTLSSADVMKGAVPFVVADLFRVALLLAVPALATWLPGTM